MRLTVKIVVTALVLVAASAGLYYVQPLAPGKRSAPARGPGPAPGRPVEARDAAAAKRDRIVALGRLEPASKIINVGAPPGDRVGRLAVAEGDEVRAGAILAWLESHDERLARRRYMASRLAEAESRLAAETAYGQALISEAEVRVRNLETVVPLDIKVQEAAVRTLEADVENAERDLRRIERLVQQSLVAQQQLDHQLTLVRRNRSELEGARVSLSRLRDGREIDLAAARAQLSSARAGLSRAQSSIELDSLRRDLALADAQLERSVIRTTIPGRILKIQTRAGEKTGDGPILQIADTSQMYAVAEVYETDIRSVRPGQRASVSSAGLPRRLTGRVDYVAAIISKNVILALDPAADADRRVGEVRIRLDESDVAGRLVNLQVDVEIHVDGR